jgi:hypothetical protein
METGRKCDRQMEAATMNVTRNFLILACVVVTMGTASNVRADFVFGERVNLGPVVNSPYADMGPFVAPDGLTLYFDSDRPGGLGGSDIWVTTQATVSDAWGPPVNLGAPVNSEYDESLLHPAKVKLLCDLGVRC